MDQYINILKDNPIFWMSLDSKELFHSNFLEYLWTLDTNAFIKMINGFLPTNKLPNGNAINYNVKRELNSFDLCIYHTTKGKRGGNIIIYDLILENKVKSIPYKEQLDEYRIEATNNNPDCRFILLTLSDDFPDKGTQTLSSWVVVSYDQLRAGIECFKNDYLANNGNNKHCYYIDDYCDFIKTLCYLKQFILPADLSNSLLFDADISKALEPIRLDDLFIKLRSAWFGLHLKKELEEEKGITVGVVHSFDDMMTPGVYINVAMNQGVKGQVAAWICDQNMNVFEIVIQGDQYRHGINQRNCAVAGKNEMKLNNCYLRLLSPSLSAAKSFLDFNGLTNVQPLKAVNFRKKGVLKSGPFDNYGDSYIYRYIKCDKEPIKELLSRMAQEIDDISKNIPNLQ